MQSRKSAWRTLYNQDIKKSSIDMIIIQDIKHHLSIENI